MGQTTRNCYNLKVINYNNTSSKPPQSCGYKQQQHQQRKTKKRMSSEMEQRTFSHFLECFAVSVPGHVFFSCSVSLNDFPRHANIGEYTQYFRLISISFVPFIWLHKRENSLVCVKVLCFFCLAVNETVERIGGGGGGEKRERKRHHWRTTEETAN